MKLNLSHPQFQIGTAAPNNENGNDTYAHKAVNLLYMKIISGWV